MAARIPSYKPERRKYERDDAAALNRTREAAAAIRELQSNLATEGQQRTDTIDHMVSIFSGTHSLGVPDDKRYVSFDSKSAKPADIIFRIMGMLTADIRYQYIAPAGSSKTTADERQDSIEAHLNALYPWLFAKYGVRWDYQASFWQLLAGVSYIQQSYLPFHWDKTVMKQKEGEGNDEYNERFEGYVGYQGPPVFVESIDPRMIWPVRTPMGVTAWVKMYQVSRYEFDSAFRRRKKQVRYTEQGTIDGVEDLRKTPGLEYPQQADIGASTSIDYYEYIDDVMCYYIASDKVIDVYQHNGGIKIFPAYGLQTGLPEPHLSSVGVLWAVRNEIPQFDFLRTLWAQKAYLDVFPQLFAILGDKENPLEDEAGNPQEWDIEPGTVKQIRGQLVNALKDASTGIDFRAMIEMTAGDIDLATISGLARGVAGAQQPGYSINQLTQSMRTQWKPIIGSRELQYVGMAMHYLWMVKHIIKRPVSLFSITEEEDGRARGKYLPIKAEDIEDFAHVRALLEPELPIDAQGQMLTNWKLYQEGGQTWEGYVRDGLNKSNPIALKRQVRLDQMEKAMLPKILEDAMALGRVKLGVEVLKAAGLDELNTTFGMDLQALKAARSTQPAPGDPNAPPPPAAPPGPPSGGPPGQPGAGPAVAPGTAGVTGGDGIAPTVGANPNNPTPGPRIGI